MMLNTTGLTSYMAERELIRIRREEGLPFPWTDDVILQTYKFTNVRRSDDRTSRAFAAFYREHYERAGDEELLYNCGVARYFGTVGFQRNVGWMSKHDSRKLSAVASAMQDRGEQVFTGAYMITNSGRSGAKHVVVATYLRGLWNEARAIVAVGRESRSWEAMYRKLIRLPGFGGTGFMAKEVLQDFLYMSNLTFHDAETWTPMGPGARRGMNRLQWREVRYRQPEELWIQEVQALHQYLAPWWLRLYSKRLTAHDVQFNLCEFDKYERVRLGEGRPRSRYAPTAG